MRPLRWCSWRALKAAPVQMSCSSHISMDSVQAMSLARRTGTDRVLPWEQLGQSGVAAPYAERPPSVLPPRVRAGGPTYPRRNGLGTYRGGRSGARPPAAARR